MDERWWQLMEERHDTGPLPTHDSRCESPIERLLFPALQEHAAKRGYEVEPQFELGFFRYDFVIKRAGDPVAVIECDSREFHSRPEQLKRDAEKDAVAKKNGLRIFRFMGQSIRSNPMRCAEDVFFGLWEAS